MVRDFHRVIGLEAREQVLERTGRLRTPSRRASAAGPTRSGSSTRSSTTRRPAGRVRARRRRRRDRPARRDAVRGLARRAARRDELPAAGRGRADGRVVLDLGGSGLPRRRARARPAQGPRPGAVPARHRRRGDGRVRAALAAPRGSSRRSRCACASRVRWSWAASWARRGDPGEPVRARRQGRRHRREVVRHDRRGGERRGRRRHAIAQGRDTGPLQTSFAEPGAQTEGIQL